MTEPERTLDAYVEAVARRRRLFVPDAARRDTRRGYAIEPVGAALHATQIHALALVQDASILLSGGADGYVRWYDLPASLNGRNMLTQNLRNTFVEGVTKGGVLCTWWGHAHYAPGDASAREPPLSAVHSLACQREGLWGVSGGESGNINLWGIRHAPGATRHVFWKHSGAVSALALSGAEDVLVSGGWDRGVHEWDLNTGQIVKSYDGCAGQISAILFRPQGGPPAPVHPRAADAPAPAASVPESPDESQLAAELDESLKAEPERPEGDSPQSDDSLFGDEPMEEERPGALALPGQGSGTAAPGPAAAAPPPPPPSAAPRTNVSELPKPGFGAMDLAWQYDSDMSQFSNDILLTSTLSGQVLIWDRRVDPRTKKGVRALELPPGTPPWCTGACWSWTGDRIYVGRRNETVDEWDVRMLPDMSGAPRSAAHGTAPRMLSTLRMPRGSGPVSSVAMLPNDQHLVCASHDNIRLWNTAAGQRGVPFKIIAGHHGGTVSHMLVDASARLLLTASGDRGWFASSTETLLMHEIHAL